MAVRLRSLIFHVQGWGPAWKSQTNQLLDHMAKEDVVPIALMEKEGRMKGLRVIVMKF